jgi:hypothetical protein
MPCLADTCSWRIRGFDTWFQSRQLQVGVSQVRTAITVHVHRTRLSNKKGSIKAVSHPSRHLQVVRLQLQRCVAGRLPGQGAAQGIGTLQE